jgi:hypothetical protein
MSGLRAENGGWTYQDRDGIHIKPFHGCVHTEADNYERGNFVVGYRRLLNPSDWAVWRLDEEEPTARGCRTSAAARQWVEAHEI